jgi:Distinct helicase family with a unique C-terminal domain including a metal-binding cysteine cluster
MLALNGFMATQSMAAQFDSINDIGIIKFCEQYGENFIEHIKEFGKESSLSVDDTIKDFQIIKHAVLAEGKRNEYKNNNKETSAFDVFYQEGFIPSYSFPKNVVNFVVEKESDRGENAPREILHAPERDIAIALSEYAPGRFVTIDKKIYKSGGLYASPRPKGYAKEQAKFYFNSSDYYKTISICSECNWFGPDKDDENRNACPYCGAKIEKNDVLRPWGFAPTNGVEVKHEGEDEQYTYAESPYYSYVPDDIQMTPFSNSRIRFADLPDRKMLMVNMGKRKKGFNVCKICGGADVAGENGNSAPSLSQPYHDMNQTCNHTGTVVKNIYLGYEFLTDMFMLDIKYDSKKLVGSSSAEEKSILRAASTTLHEALKKAISLVLDIDYNEINGGWMPRAINSDDSHIEMFFYDNLTSGAGYSILIGSVLNKVLDTARKNLDECECSRSCKNCLDNYWNQRRHQLFDRQLGLQLLDFIQFDRIPGDYSTSEQSTLLAPLEKLISEDGTAKTVEFDVFPALRKKPSNTKNKMYLNPYDLNDWLPNAFMTYKNL